MGRRNNGFAVLSSDESGVSLPLAITAGVAAALVAGVVALTGCGAGTSKHAGPQPAPTADSVTTTVAPPLLSFDPSSTTLSP